MNKIPLLKCTSIYKSYRNESKKKYILNNVSLTLKKGEMVSIFGSSGSGKSTLLHIIGGLDSPDSGKIFF
ncbi:ATP-binding cassette domain-containing protein [Buchnera aphidicola (Melaphis rhois)]|uniref:ATP-binding cassette domain-containing protein n=1 Tax=Buchnera aphidicola subsp. Melaphis rhois TaxID=118103 RepID=A0A4D6YCD4_BUCMH|nr:ATP-binding cassette domain-containing protein [Buchnera aphidicola (Melaphis rhois)]